MVLCLLWSLVTWPFCLVSGIIGSIFTTTCGNIVLLLGALGGAAYVHFQNKRGAKLAKLQAEWLMAGKDVVVLHQPSRATYCPNPSPFPIKIETYMRIMGIKYVIDNEEERGPKGKTPWITVNGQEIADSQLAIEYLQDELKKDIDKHLTPLNQAIARYNKCNSNPLSQLLSITPILFQVSEDFN